MFNAFTSATNIDSDLSKSHVKNSLYVRKDKKKFMSKRTLLTKLNAKHVKEDADGHCHTHSCSAVRNNSSVVVFSCFFFSLICIIVV